MVGVEGIETVCRGTDEGGEGNVVVDVAPSAAVGGANEMIARKGPEIVVETLDATHVEGGIAGR